MEELRRNTTWVAEEYEAGHQARYQEIAESKTATPSWRAGWQEANREMTMSDCAGVRTFGHDDSQQRPETDGSGSPTKDGRCAFDEDQSESWKLSWIQADIALGLKSEDCRSLRQAAS